MISFLLPSGPKNLTTLFPLVDFATVEEYYLKVMDDTTAVLTTNRFIRVPCDCDLLWIYFVNYLGGIDCIPFQLLTETHETKSSTWRKALKYPLAKWDGGLQRSNVTATDTTVAECPWFREEDQAYLKELLDSPNAWIAWKGTQGQPDDYLPIVIQDGKFITRKSEERYDYGLQIEWVMSNDTITLRN